MKFEFNFLRKEMINENDNKSTTYGSRIAANNIKQRLRRIACRTAHEWLDKSDEVFEQFHEKHRCDVSVVLYPPKDYVYDPPNYSPTSKAIIDGLTDAGIWSDDNKNIIRRTSFEHGGLSGDTKKWKIELVVKVMQVGALIAIVLSKLPISRRLWNERKKRRRKTFF